MRYHVAPHSAHAAPTILPAAQVEIAEEPQVTLTPEEPANEEPEPEEEPEAAEPAPVMPSIQEQAIKRAALPEHLRLGVTLPGMRELLAEQPSDAVEQINAKIPLDKAGQPKYPKNKALNGATSSNS